MANMKYHVPNALTTINLHHESKAAIQGSQSRNLSSIGRGGLLISYSIAAAQPLRACFPTITHVIALRPDDGVVDSTPSLTSEGT
jgi:hypothetical protein